MFKIVFAQQRSQSHLGAESVSADLFVAANVVRRIAPIPAGLVAVLVRHVGELEVAVHLVVGAVVLGAIVAIGQSSGDDGQKNKNNKGLHGDQVRTVGPSVALSFLYENAMVEKLLSPSRRAIRHEGARFMPLPENFSLFP